MTPSSDHTAGNGAPGLNGSARAAAASPSLAGPMGATEPAYEFKFLLGEERALEVKSRLAGVLAPDPHGDPALGGAYLITSLYCDTPSWGVYYREGEDGVRKYRVRRYGDGGGVYLEVKEVRSRSVRKQRTGVSIADLALVEANEMGWPGAWFARQVAQRGLRPVCRIAYQRLAFFGESREGPMRVTFDRGVRGGLAGAWGFAPAEREVPLLAGAVVCEFKFRGEMPGPMRAVAVSMGLSAQGVSKYRCCIDAFAPELGLARREVDARA